MADFNVLRTNHTSFTVSDLDRIIGFFCDGLGFEMINRSPRDPKLVQQISGIPGADIEVAYIQGPEHRLELIQYHGPDDRGQVDCRPCDAGYAHLAYDVDDIDAAMSAAKKYTFTELGAPVAIDKGPNTGNRVVYMRDADGVTVEFIEKPS